MLRRAPLYLPIQGRAHGHGVAVAREGQVLEPSHLLEPDSQSETYGVASSGFESFYNLSQNIEPTRSQKIRSRARTMSYPRIFSFGEKHANIVIRLHKTFSKPSTLKTPHYRCTWIVIKMNTTSDEVARHRPGCCPACGRRRARPPPAATPRAAAPPPAPPSLPSRTPSA